MKVTPEILGHEFIGTKTKITRSTHTGHVGLHGQIVDETRNTFTILRKGHRKMVPKDSATFDFSFDDGTIVEIEGKLLTGRPEDRLKKNVRRLW